MSLETWGSGFMDFEIHPFQGGKISKFFIGTLLFVQLGFVGVEILPFQGRGEFFLKLFYRYVLFLFLGGILTVGLWG